MAVPAPVNSAFCVPEEAHLEIIRNVKSCSRYKFDFAINDAQGNFLFDAKDKKNPGFHPFSLTKLVLRDASGKVILLLKQKRWSGHWLAYRGDDDIQENILFAVGYSSGFCTGTTFEVYLATSFNSSIPRFNSSIPDFTVKKERFGKTYTFLYHGTPVAEARMKMEGSLFSTPRDEYVVTAYPGTDQAFVAALFVVIMVQLIWARESSSAAASA